MFDFAPPPPAQPVPLQQSALFNLALVRLGVDLTHHALPGGSATVLLRRVRGLGPVGLVSRGPVWTGGTETMRADGLAGMRAALGLRHLVVSPEFAREEDQMRRAGFFRIARPADVAMLSLDGTPQDWLHRMDGKWRNRLRHARAQGLVAERHDFVPTGDHWLFARDGEQKRLRNYRSLSHPLLAEIAKGQPGAAQLFIARQGRVAMAAMLFLGHGAMATYQIGWTTHEGKAVSAHNLLMWEAMQALAARGHRVIDLGIIGSRRMEGIDRFKLGAGAEAQMLGGTWLNSAWSAPAHGLRRWRRAEV